MAYEVQLENARPGWPEAMSVLLAGGSAEEAGEAAGVSGRTVRRWREDEEFQAIFRQHMRRLLDQAADQASAKLAKAGSAAATRLISGMREEGRKGAWAADRVLQHIFRLGGRMVQKHEHSGAVEFAAVLRRISEEGPRPLPEATVTEVEE